MERWPWERWVERHGGVVAMICGLVAIGLGIDAITYRGRNQAPASFPPFFFTVGIIFLAVGLAEIRKQRKQRSKSGD